MTPRIEKTVFISYRRTNFWTALAVFQNLHSNGYDVFFDYKSIPSGDFEQVITENVKSRAHFIVILSPSALDRCNEPEDWLRREIETAIENKRNIISLMMEGFDFGSPSTAEVMTGKLANLKKYNALSIPSEYFEEAMAKLRSERFLTRPIESVSHPISEITKQITEGQISAANAAAPVKEQQLTAQEWFERGYSFALKNNVEESIRCFTEAINLKPSYEAYFNRAIFRRAIGDPVGAIQDYSLAIEINPNEDQAYNNRGNARRDIGDLDGALLDYNKGLIKKPGSPKVLINRGVVQKLKGNLDNARDDFAEAVESKPSPTDLVEALDNLGIIRQTIGDFEEAAKQYQKAINVWPFHVLARAHLISVFQKTGKFSEVKEQEKIIQEMLQLENEYNQACFESVCGNANRALILLKIGLEKKQATKVWAKLDPDFDNIRHDPRFKELVDE
jgi:tetratricopeptide (TPR) repeat protein